MCSRQGFSNVLQTGFSQTSSRQHQSCAEAARSCWNEVSIRKGPDGTMQRFRQPRPRGAVQPRSPQHCFLFASSIRPRTNYAHAVVQAARPKAPLRDLETATAPQQQVCRRHPHPLKPHLQSTQTCKHLENCAGRSIRMFSLGPERQNCCEVVPWFCIVDVQVLAGSRAAAQCALSTPAKWMRFISEMRTPRGGRAVHRHSRTPPAGAPL